MAWKRLSGGNFFKFQDEGDTLVGTWQGTSDGKYGKNGMLKTNDGMVKFGLSAALSDLEFLDKGTMIKLVYIGKEMTQSGTEFKAFNIFVDDEYDGNVAGDNQSGRPEGDTSEKFEATQDDVPF